MKIDKKNIIITLPPLCPQLGGALELANLLKALDLAVASLDP